MNLLNLFASRKSVIDPEPTPKPEPAEIAVSHLGFFAGQSPLVLWDPDRLKASQGPGVYREMLRDDQVKAAYMLVVDTIVGRKFRFVPDQKAENPERQTMLAEFLNHNTEQSIRGTFIGALKQILTSKLTGFSVNEIVVEASDWDGSSRWVLRALKLRPAETFQFEVDQYANVLTILQQQAGGPKRLDPRKFVIHVANRELDPIYGESDLRAVYRHYWSKQNILRFQEIGLERYASGFVVAKIGAEVGLSTADRDNLRNSLNNLQASTSITVPAGVEIELIQPASTDAHEKAIAQRDVAIARGLLMPNLLGLTPQSQVGAFAQSKTQQDLFFHLLSRQGDDLADTLNEQLWRPLVWWNFGESVYPRMVFEQYNDEEKRNIVSAFIAGVQGHIIVNTFEDENRNRELLGYEPREETVDDGGAVVEPAAEEQGQEQRKETEDQEGMPAKMADTKRAKPQRLDFKAVEQTFNADGRASGEALASRIDLLYADIQTAIQAGKGPAEIDMAIQPAHKAALREAILVHLKGAYAYGRSQGIDELQTAAAGAPLAMAERVTLAAKMARRRAARNPENMVAEFVSGLSLDTAEKYFSDKAFAMTGQLTDEMLAKAKLILLNGIRDEKALDEIIKELDATLKDVIGERDAAGHRINVPARLETIVRTTYTEAFNQARMSVFTDPDLGGFVEALEYSAILDIRTTPFCQATNGNVYPIDDPVWSRITPPNHFNALVAGTKILTQSGYVPIECVKPGTPVVTHRGRLRQVYALMGKEPDAPMVKELRLSTGGRLRITDEHPILTSCGWKSAGDLKPGDVLFEHGQQVQGIGDILLPDPKDFPSYDNERGVPYQVAFFSGARVMPFAIDFKNDPIVKEGKIRDIAAERELHFKSNCAFIENICASGLQGGGFMAHRIGPSDIPLAENSVRSSGIIRNHALRVSGSPRRSFLAEPPRPMSRAARSIGVVGGIGDFDLFNAGAYSDPVAFSPHLQNGIANADGTFNGAQGFSILPVPNADQFFNDGFVSEIHGVPFKWIPATIISIADVRCNESLWNLAVEEDETYIAGGVIVHNCRSILIPVTVLDQWEASKPLPESVRPQEGFR